MKYLEGLNPAQQEAIHHTHGPLLIIAGAGAGKTRVITHRILHLIHEGIAPEKILAITFTNKAAGEMRERVRLLIEKDPIISKTVGPGHEPFISTFHALSVRIIRENAETIGLKRHFTILDRSDSLRLIKEAIRMKGLDPKTNEPSKFLSIISRLKGEGDTAEAHRAHVDGYHDELITDVWEAYDGLARKEGALDFDDLLAKTAILLKQPVISARYKERFSHIHIDEYQDTNKIQYEIARSLLSQEENIAVVGDIDQTIYSWRGADIRNILEFEKDFPRAKVVILEENYRSTKRILDVANRIIEKNKKRRKKTLFTANPDGDKIGLFTAVDEMDEARFIAEKSADLIQNGIPANKIAVLFRTNFQSRSIEEGFLKGGVAYQVIGTRFFERKEVKDTLSYLRASINPDSAGDVKRALSFPSRGFGEVSVLKILSGKSGTLTPKLRESYNVFLGIMEEIRNRIKTDSPSAVMRYIIQVSGIERTLKDGNAEDIERLENVRELATIATRFDGMPKPEGIESFLSDSSLASDQDDLDKKQDGVKLMTVHSAKGLEFHTVFIAGLEDGLFPHKVGSNSEDDREEERRLFYVAITRAEKKVILSYASIRTIFGMKEFSVPSEFVFEIDEADIESEGGWSDKPVKTIYFD